MRKKYLRYGTTGEVGKRLFFVGFTMSIQAGSNYILYCE